MPLRYTLPLLAAAACLGQTPAQLIADPSVRAALEAARHEEPRTLDLQARLCEIPAPPFQEAARGLEVRRLFHELGLRDVRTDPAGSDNRRARNFSIAVDRAQGRVDLDRPHGGKGR